MFTVINANVKLDAGSGWTLWSSKCYFHPQDIANVLNQPGAISVQVENAKINGHECLVLIAVSQVDENDEVIARLDRPNDLIAVGCPPFRARGGVFDPNPTLP